MQEDFEQDAGMPQLITGAEVAKALGVSARTMTNLVKTGSLPKPVTLPGGAHRYVESEIKAMMKRMFDQRHSAE